MVDQVEKNSGPDGSSSIEDHGAKSGMKKCETFGCRDIAKQMYQIAPGTNVWLCDKCTKEMDKEEVG